MGGDWGFCCAVFAWLRLACIWSKAAARQASSSVAGSAPTGTATLLIANKAPCASQPAMDMVTGTAANISARLARSGLHGRTVRIPSNSTVRQSKPGLQALSHSASMQTWSPPSPCRLRSLAHNGAVGSLEALTPALYSMPLSRRVTLNGLALAPALVGGLWLGLRPAYAPDAPVVLLDGSTRPGAALAGQVTLVNFWASTCAICLAEMPQMVALFKAYCDQGFATVAVAMAYDPPASVIRYSESRQLPFDVVIDNTGSVARAWGGVQATPTSFLVNRRGEIVQHWVGAPDFGLLAENIEKLLKQV